ncbi:hypothetical protein PUN28_003260 [Cardiocondyla obscurior]|uniref:Uncharacterized protein n=1 Tax=Cardiocondyla obscurior TaxID=286306 RepID=A0AAW2GN18_9HYME
MNSLLRRRAEGEEGGEGSKSVRRRVRVLIERLDKESISSDVISATIRRSEFPPTEDEKRARREGGSGEGRAGGLRVRARKDKSGRRNLRTSFLPTDLFRYLSASAMGLRRPRAVDFCNCIGESRSVLFRECRWRYIDRQYAMPSLWSPTSLYSLSVYHQT